MALDIKRVPRWAYYASGAVVVGAVGLKVWNGRGGGVTPEAVPASTDPNAPTSTYATTSTVPVFVGGDNADSSGGDGQSYFGALVDGAFGLATSALGAANKTTETISEAFTGTTAAYNEAQGQYADIVGQLGQQALSNQNDYAKSVADIMAAGQAPAAVQQTPVINYQPPAAQAPVSIPANPTAVAPTPSAPAHNPAFNHYNNATKEWYDVRNAATAGRDSTGTSYKKGTQIHVYENTGRIVIAS